MPQGLWATLSQDEDISIISDENAWKACKIGRDTYHKDEEDAGPHFYPGF